MDESINVFGEVLQDCSLDPVTGFFRNGCCDTSDQDAGSHTCLLYTSPSPRDQRGSRMPSSA